MIPVVDCLFYALYRLSVNSLGEDREPEWGAATAVAALLSANAISVVALLHADVWNTVRGAPFGFSLVICAVTLAVAHIAFLWRGRWKTIVEKCSRQGGAARAIYAWGSAAYIVATAALFGLAIQNLWPK